MENSQNKKAISWLSWAHFTNDIYTGFVNPIMPFISAKIGISMAIATVVLSISNIFSSLLQPIFGFFADNMLKRAFIFWGVSVAVFITRNPPVLLINLQVRMTVEQDKWVDL